jgi:2-polyprenyl-3-methyl-5-hydroxy-6-metoxy-1,4-benzoquinol methylase
LQLSNLAGIDYDPFTRRASITGDTSVNYLAHFLLPAGAG